MYSSTRHKRSSSSRMQVSPDWSEVVPQTVEHLGADQECGNSDSRFSVWPSAPAELQSALKCEVLPYCIWGYFLACPFTPLSVTPKPMVYTETVYKCEDQKQHRQWNNLVTHINDTFTIQHGSPTKEHARDGEGEEAEPCSLVRGIRENDLGDAVCTQTMFSKFIPHLFTVVVAMLFRGFLGTSGNTLYYETAKSLKCTVKVFAVLYMSTYQRITR